jgi:hypothetical protein
MPLFVAAIFISSFLLFAVQPMVAKFLLPSFGGTAAVWATCLVVFQTLLLAGYSYAHLLRTALSPKMQRWTHLGVLAVALLFLPPAPTVAANAAAAPVWNLLRSLLTSIGVPFFALSATAPLLMEWFRQSFPERTAHRLYAFSNAGSLLALLAYPVLLEPLFTRTMQARVWAGGMVLFLVVCAMTAWTSLRRVSVEEVKTLLAPALSPEAKGAISNNQLSTLNSQLQGPLKSAATGRCLWVALPACGSGLLLALTNQISQDVAPMPLLWVAPVAVYLLTFILCFEGPRSYRRVFFIPAAFAGFLFLAWLLDQGYLQGFAVQVGGYLAVLLLGCMVCHGELYRLRPPLEHLTGYYLAISLGGALGGVFVALVAPTIFRTILETPIIAVALAALSTFIIWRENAGPEVATSGNKTAKYAKHVEKKSPGGSTSAYSAYSAVSRNPHPLLFGLSPSLAALGGTLAVVAALIYVIVDQRKESIYYTRSFYGAYRVKEGPTLLLNGIHFPLGPGTARVLLSGQIYHGLQFTAPAAAMIPTTYYCEEGGLGLAFNALPATTNRHIGAIGLGAGTLASYGRDGDRIRFYELNPDVLHIATNDFTFLYRTPAKTDVVLGDGRLSLARDTNQFDLFVLDAFAGDSIPMHLLTDEAMRIYVRHLKPDGVLAFHISNSHLDLEPVVRALAEKYDFTAALVPAKFMDAGQGKLPSIWMLLCAKADFFNQPGIATLSTRLPEGRRPILWTDDYSSILPILH